jgi:hypothetical protein
VTTCRPLRSEVIQHAKGVAFWPRRQCPILGAVATRGRTLGVVA